MAVDANRLSTEIAHVLFLDLVGYSRLSMEEQMRLTRELRDVVRLTNEFQRAEGRSELIPLDLGDGMALVFFRDPISPVQCATEISHACQAHSHLKLRIGIHSGPVTRTTDINGKENVSGGGINLAQRVMDCGDAGHILLSRQSAEVIRQFETWAASLSDLGEFAVKHGEKVHLFNLRIGEIGNPEVPSLLRTLAAERGEAVPAGAAKSAGRASSSQAGAAVKPLRIALLYKRNAQPDESLLKLLETHLSNRGHSVFVDRHLSIGVEWATEIERQIRSSDAVVALLSEASVKSEMLEYEITTAHNAAQANQGKPRILPVRIGYTGPLPDTISSILDPLHYTVWQGEEDNDRLVGDITDAVENPPELRPMLERAKLEPVGGAVPLDSEFYIVRPTDDEFRLAIARRDSIVLVKGVRQMGKTSLLARGLQQAREAGARVVLTDFQTLNAAHLQSAETFFLTVAETIADQLDLDVEPAETWNSSRGPNMNMERFLRREVLGRIEEPVVWGLDEVDRLFTCSFGSEVFGLFRSWHNRRSLDPTGPWSRLTLAIAYATEAHLFITDLNQSPFNVGTRLTLDDFTIDQVAELNRRYGGPLRGADDLRRFHRLTNGHPYLVRRGLDEMASHGMSVSVFEGQADRDEGLFGDHLRRILVSLSQDAELTEIVRGILRGEPCPTPESFYRLRSAGLMSGDSQHDIHPRCQLYASYLTRHLLGGGLNKA